MSKKQKELRLKLLFDAIDEFSHEVDNEGQIVIYTGFYEGEDGEIYDEPQDAGDESWNVYSLKSSR